MKKCLTIFFFILFSYFVNAQGNLHTFSNQQLQDKIKAR